MARNTNTTQALLDQRLLSDIADIQRNPYPGIELHFQDANALETACLILTPHGEQPMHLTIRFVDDYPLSAPEVTMQSNVVHPNIYGDYICASILNTTEGYTPAFSLKGICIQLLSFFSSDKIEQDTGGIIDRTAYQQRARDGFSRHRSAQEDGYRCSSCGFGRVGDVNVPIRNRDEIGGEVGGKADVKDAAEVGGKAAASPDQPLAGQKIHLIDLPNDILLIICEHLNDEGLSLASRAWNGFGRLIHAHNVVTIRDMCCFTLRKGFKEAKLGVGIHINKRSMQSEFDLISQQAFSDLGVRRSIQGLQFEHWLPLPLSENHWKRVEYLAEQALTSIGRSASVQGPMVNVLYTFMNDVVVKLSQAASEVEEGRQSGRFGLYGADQKSTLTHASEKAIESYWQLYHLLLCLVADSPSIADKANAWIARFMGGERDKRTCPNLGHLLVALLISDAGQTSPADAQSSPNSAAGASTSEELTKAIIKEAVTRNVVWMLDGRGAGMAELSYMEPSAISDYRLQKTFEASKTSYRLLMFLALMRRTVTNSATASATASPKTLVKMRDELFTRHGMPPNGASATLAASIRKIQKVNSFPEFLQAMGVRTIPTKSEFTRFLRHAVYDSVDKGYSKWALTQGEALAVRLQRERTVEVADGLHASHRARTGHFTFFPGEQRRDGDAGRGRSRDRGRR
ncbi:hypothetical protein LTR85_010256 [Meristemomyces frigidus]|nr:hypothetical protein LTR85_010256 [Meristemomyces frigidus]